MREMLESGLLLDFYELTMGQAYFDQGCRYRATFDLFVRDMPPARSYMVCAGLQDALDYVRGLHFTPEDRKYLRSLKVFSPAFLDYLRSFEFKGDIWAMPEGTVFFPGEPLLRVTADIIEAQLVESFLLNTINLQTMIASKAARIVQNAGGRGIFDFSLRRTHGADAAIKVARSCHITGFQGTSNVLAAKMYGIPAVGTMAHSFVMSFEKELDSFRAYCASFPQRSILLVDTYNTKKGILQALEAGKVLQKKGHKLSGIRIDSGDLIKLAFLARRMMDSAGFKGAKIILSGNLDEFKIAKIVASGAPVDYFGVGTNMGTSSDAPYLDVIYKISEISYHKDHFLPRMKLSSRKSTLPGRKQVYRVSSAGKYVRDLISLEGEHMPGEPLLAKVMQNGRLIGKHPSLTEIRGNFEEGLAGFDKAIKEAKHAYTYQVCLSPGLNKLTRDFSRELKKHIQQ